MRCSSPSATPSAPARCPSALFEDLLSAPSARTSTRRATRRGRTCWTTAGARRTRSDGSCCAWPATRTTGSTAHPTPCAPRCSSPTSGRTSSATGRRGASTCPATSATRVGAREADLDARVLSPAWRDGALRDGCAHPRGCSTRGAPCATASTAGCATSCGSRGWAACASSTASNETGFDVFTARPDAGHVRRSRPPVERDLLEPAEGRLSTAMARRDTNFYYSFVVLPDRQAPRHHRRVGLLPGGRRRCGRAGGAAGDARSRGARRPRRSRAGATNWRPATKAGSRARRRGSRSPRTWRPSTCRGSRSRT